MKAIFTARVDSFNPDKSRKILPAIINYQSFFVITIGLTSVLILYIRFSFIFSLFFILEFRVYLLNNIMMRVYVITTSTMFYFLRLRAQMHGHDIW